MRSSTAGGASACCSRRSASSYRYRTAGTRGGRRPGWLKTHSRPSAARVRTAIVAKPTSSVVPSDHPRSPITTPAPAPISPTAPEIAPVRRVMSSPYRSRFRGTDLVHRSLRKSRRGRPTRHGRVRAARRRASRSTCPSHSRRSRTQRREAPAWRYPEEQRARLCALKRFTKAPKPCRLPYSLDRGTCVR